MLSFQLLAEKKQQRTDDWGFRCLFSMSCFDSNFPKLSPPLPFSQKTKLSVSYFDVKVVWGINIPGNVWNEFFFILYESLHVWSSRRFTYLITPSQIYSTDAFPWWRLRCLRGTSLPPPPPYMSPLVKHLCTITNRNAKKCWPTSKDKWPNPQQPSGGSMQWKKKTWNWDQGLVEYCKQNYRQRV